MLSSSARVLDRTKTCSSRKRSPSPSLEHARLFRIARRTARVDRLSSIFSSSFPRAFSPRSWSCSPGALARKSARVRSPRSLSPFAHKTASRNDAQQISNSTEPSSPKIILPAHVRDHGRNDKHKTRENSPFFLAAKSFSISFLSNACLIAIESWPALRRSFCRLRTTSAHCGVIRDIHAETRDIWKKNSIARREAFVASD